MREPGAMQDESGACLLAERYNEQNLIHRRRVERASIEVIYNRANLPLHEALSESQLILAEGLHPSNIALDSV